jgi:hypothetical protein
MAEKTASALEDEQVPSYEESVMPLGRPAESKSAPGQPFSVQATEIRTRRIQHLLANYVEPVLYSHALDGIHRLTFVIIPSDVLTQHPNLGAKDIAGQPNATNTVVSRLTDESNRAAFWQQPAVLQDLTSSLRARLGAYGPQVQSSAGIPVFAPGENGETPQQQKSRSTELSPSWLKRQFAVPGPLHDPTATTDYKLGWRSDDDKGQPSPKSTPGEVQAIVNFKDISFRFETEMGLLDSATGKALSIDIDLGVT